MEIPNEKNAVNSAVPIIITHQVVKKMPKITRERKFAGFINGFASLAAEAIDLIQRHFWVEEKKVEDPGETRAVHYAIDVETDSLDEDAAHLVVSRVDPEVRPACGAHYQVVKMEPAESPGDGIIRLPDDPEDDGKSYHKPKFIANREGQQNYSRNKAPRLFDRNKPVELPDDDEDAPELRK